MTQLREAFLPTVLLRPYFLSFKNKLFSRIERTRSWSRDIVVGIISLLMMGAIYTVVSSFLVQMQSSAHYGAMIPGKLVSMSLMSFFFLLLFSNFIAVLSFFFHAKDIPLLLSLPISNVTLYLGRLLISVVNSSWVFALFAIPAIFAYKSSFHLPWTFIATAFAVSVPFLVIPAAIGSICVTLLINVIPTERLQEVLVVLSLVIAFAVVVGTQHIPTDIARQGKELQDMVAFLAVVDDPHPIWLPSRWAADIITSYFGNAPANVTLSVLLLFSTMTGLLAVGYVVFDALFLRGWTNSFFVTSRSQQVHASNLSSSLGRILLPYLPQFRSIFYKDLRMFVRDPTQCVQFLLLLMLTFVYLYNFKALRVATGISLEALGWWQTLLGISNLALGSCVIAAISTRFVFPAISLEGRAYWIVRSAPVSISQLLRYKFLMWIGPVAVTATVLLLSGAWTIGLTPDCVFLSGLLGIALSIGIVGLGIGIGAVYANFDWETPTQVAASFGSLVFMLLSLASMLITLIPASLMIILSSVPGLHNSMHYSDYAIAMMCATFLAFFINFIAARWALEAGAQALADLEK